MATSDRNLADKVAWATSRWPQGVDITSTATPTPAPPTRVPEATTTAEPGLPPLPVVGRIGGGGNSAAAVRDGVKLFVANGRTVNTFGLADPALPELIGQMQLAPLPGRRRDGAYDNILDLEAGRGWLYALVNGGGIEIFDARTGGVPRQVASLPSLAPPGLEATSGSNMLLVGDTLYVSVATSLPDRYGTVWHLVALDVSDPRRPRQLAARELGGDRFQSSIVEGPVMVAGHLAVVVEPRDAAAGSELLLLRPSPDLDIVGSLAFGAGSPTALVADGDRLQVIGYRFQEADGPFTMVTIDASDPAELREVSRMAFPGNQDMPLEDFDHCVKALRLAGRDPDYERRAHPMCAWDTDHIYEGVYDAGMAGPFLVASSTYSAIGDSMGEEVPENVAGLRILDPRAPGGPSAVGHLVTGLESMVRDPQFLDGYVYLPLDDGRLGVVDASDPSAPVQGAVLHDVGPVFKVALDDAAPGQVLTDAAVVDAADPQQLRPLGSWPADAADAVHVGDHVYRMLRHEGLAVTRWTEDGLGEELGSFTTRGVPLSLVVRDGLAFVAHTPDGTLDGFGWRGPEPFAGIQIVDVRDPAAMREVGHIGKLDGDHGDYSSLYDDLGRATNGMMAVTDHGLIVATGEDLLRYDVSRPDAPRLVATATVGNLIWQLANGDGWLAVSALGNAEPVIGLGNLDVQLFDLTRPGLTPVGHIRRPTDAGRALLAADGHRLVVSDSAGIAVYDVSDPAAPHRIHAWATPPVSVSGMALRGDTLFLAAGWDGLLAVALPR